MGSLSPIENTRKREDSSVNDRDKKNQSWRNSYPFSYSNVDQLFRITDIRNLNSDDTFLVIDSKGDSYSIYFDIENNIFEIDIENNIFGIDNDHVFYLYNWNNHINNSILSSICGSDNYIDNSILSYICENLGTITNDRNLTKRENLDVIQENLTEKIKGL
uniref:Acetyl-CoA carboxylase carboxyltransferase beta subunit n=1 Tax=Silene noctiflora TaxID=39899 RepID=H2BLW0_9CARY|nr:acetyl-CoA carboxylase carboxyltransferase beta subunit [Silene noctiflora]AEC04160.1 acetyl-CoA carboxylase carboxyltransferase beta subunit [Silene noctiflora]WFF47157.1 acetyl-CoA carboxylase carboxyltransferase beta subunit [Silene noctiflora]